jgi:hypothetical protein
MKLQEVITSILAHEKAESRLAVLARDVARVAARLQTAPEDIVAGKPFALGPYPTSAEINDAAAAYQGAVDRLSKVWKSLDDGERLSMHGVSAIRLPPWLTD